MLHSKVTLPSIALILAATISGCGSSDDDAATEPEFLIQEPVEDPAQRVGFADASAELDPFFRGEGPFGREGYGGVAWLDYDNDGNLDLLLTNEKDYPTTLFRNDGDGSFSDVTVAAGLGDVTEGTSAAVAGDINNDGCVDLFLSGSGLFTWTEQAPTVMLLNRCDGTFEDISAWSNTPGASRTPTVRQPEFTSTRGTALSAAFADINNDGLIDLFVTAQGHLGLGNPLRGEQHSDRLYLNNGPSTDPVSGKEIVTFTDISESAGVDGALGSCVVTFSHFDDDEFIDLFVGICNDVTLAFTPWHVYRNNGDNTFTDVAASTQLDKVGLWMASAFGDIDNDGDFDIYSTNAGGLATHHLWRNNGDGTYVDIAPDNGDTRDFWAWGATFADFDNDGFQDLYYAGELPGTGCTFAGLEQGNLLGQGNRGFLFFNNGDSRFTVANQELDAPLDDLRCRGATGVAKADYNNDGFVDLVVMTAATQEFPVAAPVLMRNKGNTNNWVSIQLRGTQSNAMGIGARIEVLTNNGVFQAREVWAGSSFASSESPWPVFGLGKATAVKTTVYWPSGLVESFTGLEANKLHALTEGEGFELSPAR